MEPLCQKSAHQVQIAQEEQFSHSIVSQAPTVHLRLLSRLCVREVSTVQAVVTFCLSVRMEPTVPRARPSLTNVQEALTARVLRIISIYRPPVCLVAVDSTWNSVSSGLVAKIARLGMSASGWPTQTSRQALRLTTDITAPQVSTAPVPHMRRNLAPSPHSISIKGNPPSKIVFNVWKGTIMTWLDRPAVRNAALPHSLPQALSLANALAPTVVL